MLSFGVGPGCGRTTTTFRIAFGSCDVGGDETRGSAEIDAARTKSSSLRWRVSVCAYVGLNVERLVTVVEPSGVFVEIRKRGCDVPGSVVVSLVAGGE